MSHDELLLKINEPNHWFKPFLDIRQALIAVVELHKPHNVVKDMCDACSGLDARDYPCSTILAIEKELR